MEIPTTRIRDIYTSFNEEYQALQDVVVFDRSDTGFLFLTGKDVLDFLQRISTNELLGLQEGDIRSTVLVTEKARIIDLVTVIPTNNGYLLDVGPHARKRILDWLKMYIIMEDVKVNDVTSDFAKATLAGSKVVSLLNSFDFPASDATVHHLDLRGRRITLHRDPLFPGDVWNIYCKKNDIAGALSDLRATASQNFPMHPAGRQVFETFRIEQGVPLSSKELTEHVNPLEAGLRHLISFKKGCYIGQEVIARLTTYDKLQHKLTGFSSKSIIEGEGQVYRGNEVVGWTTSHTYSPHLNQHIALGYLKVSAGRAGLDLRTEAGDELSLDPVDLPFVRYDNSP